jgi:hypothetical protein
MPLETFIREVGQGMPNDKAVTVRLPIELYEDLLALSIIDDNSVADQVRTGLPVYVAQRRSDPTFDDQVQDAMNKRTNVLSTFAARSKTQ